MTYYKSEQLQSNKVKTKYCPKCKQDLLVTNFSSTRKKICSNCEVIKKLEQKQEMTSKALGRIHKKKQKTKEITSLSDLKKTVQKYVNKYVRLRDKNLPCISCGKKLDKGDCGHYIAQGSSGLLRFNEDNLNLQCTTCNRWKHGNLIEYRAGLIKKIGEQRVSWLEEHRRDIKRWTREELEELLQEYKEKLKKYDNN